MKLANALVKLSIILDFMYRDTISKKITPFFIIEIDVKTRSALYNDYFFLYFKRLKYIASP